MVCIPNEEGDYTIRKLTEWEYALLQGFPADYCDGLVYDEVTDEDLAFWRKVWDEWCETRGIRNKSDKQIRKWLQTEPSKSAQYKMWGNGVALPIPEYILSKIVDFEK